MWQSAYWVLRDWQEYLLHNYKNDTQMYMIPAGVYSTFSPWNTQTTHVLSQKIIASSNMPFHHSQDCQHWLIITRVVYTHLTSTAQKNNWPQHMSRPLICTTHVQSHVHCKQNTALSPNVTLGRLRSVVHMLVIGLMLISNLTLASFFRCWHNNVYASYPRFTST